MFYNKWSYVYSKTLQIKEDELEPLTLQTLEAPEMRRYQEPIILIGTAGVFLKILKYITESQQIMVQTWKPAGRLKAPAQLAIFPFQAWIWIRLFGLFLFILGNLVITFFKAVGTRLLRRVFETQVFLFCFLGPLYRRVATLPNSPLRIGPWTQRLLNINNHNEYRKISKYFVIMIIAIMNEPWVFISPFLVRKRDLYREDRKLRETPLSTSSKGWRLKVYHCQSNKKREGEEHGKQFPKRIFKWWMIFNIKEIMVFSSTWIHVLHHFCLLLARPIIRNTSPDAINLTLSLQTRDLKIDCDVSAFPKAKVTWKKGVRQLPADRFKQEANGALLITEASYEDSGTYACTASNELGTDNANFTVIIYGNYIPLSIQLKPSIFFGVTS